MADFFATVLAKVAVSLLEVFVKWLLQSAFKTPSTSAKAAPVAFA